MAKEAALAEINCKGKLRVKDICVMHIMRMCICVMHIMRIQLKMNIFNSSFNVTSLISLVSFD